MAISISLALSALASTPLVMPEVVTGLSLLLLFIGMEGLFGYRRAWYRHHHHRTCQGRRVFCRLPQACLRDFDMSIEEVEAILRASLIFSFPSLCR